MAYKEIKHEASQMKVLHFIESAGLYGAESVILNLSREMIKSGNKFQPVIGCIVSKLSDNSDLYNKAIEYGLLAEKIIIRNTLLPLDIPKVARKIKNEKISLIHSHGYKPSVFGFPISLLSGIPIMATCHLWFLEGKIPIKMRIMIRLELLFYKFFPIVVGVSEPIKQTLVNNGVNSEKVKIIDNGIPIDDYCYRDQKKLSILRKELCIDSGDICILNVGRLNPQKGQNHIIKAAKIVISKGYRAKFFIVGEGHLREYLKRRIRRNGLEGNVFLLGFRQDIKELLQLSDIFVLPSLDEGMPIAVLEAAATMTPIIATAVGDIPKFIKNRETGFLIEKGSASALAEAITTLIEQNKLRERLSFQAFLVLKKKYSSELMYQKYKAVYEFLARR